MDVPEEISSRFVLVHAYPALTRLSSGPEACRDLLLTICQVAQNDPGRYFIVPLGRTFQTFLDYWISSPRNVIFLNFEKIHPSIRVISVPYLTNYPLSFDFLVPPYSERSYRSVFCGNHRSGIRGGIIHDIRTRASSTHAVFNVEPGRSKWIPSNASAARISAAKENAQFAYEPPGDTPARKSLYDTIIAGAVPVIFLTDRYYLPFSEFLDWDMIAVQLMKSPSGGFTCLQTGQKSQSVVDLIDRFPDDVATEMQSYIMRIRNIFRFGNGLLSVSRAIELELVNLLRRL